MDIALFLLASLFISPTPTTLVVAVAEVSQKTWLNEPKESHHQPSDSGIHLTLHHIHRLPTASDLLARDEARVQSINYRRLILKSKSTTGSRTKRSAAAAAAAATELIYHEAHGDANNSSKSKVSGDGGGVSVGLEPGTSIGVANYYIKLGLGTPVGYYDMLVDTGSSLTWLQCKPCEVYCHPQAGPVFNPSMSKTYKYLTCDAPQCSALEAATLNAPMCSASTKKCIYEASYGDRSYSVGFLSKDTLTLSSTSNPTLQDFAFGCGEDTQGLFGRSAGLIGFARDSLSMSAQLSPKYGFIFSYCLPTRTSEGSSSTTGTLSIGRSSLYSYKNSKENATLASDVAVPYALTPMIKDPDNPSLYFLQWTGMTVSGKPLA
ncbi:Aspartyl protease family protein, partial [Thalictrum thalictroides]